MTESTLTERMTGMNAFHKFLLKHRRCTEIKVQKEARFMAEKYGITENVASILIYHGMQMGIDAAKEIVCQPLNEQTK